MKVEDVRKRVAAIEAVAAEGDDEKAHSMEDELWYDVLLAISRYHQTSYTPAMAREAIKTKDIDFQRNCA